MQNQTRLKSCTVACAYVKLISIQIANESLPEDLEKHELKLFIKTVSSMLELNSRPTHAATLTAKSNKNFLITELEMA